MARALRGYEPRPGQLEMASLVERCLDREGVAVIEAGTGTGKTFAYLVPALACAGRKKIVISTATRALQDQIFYKDLPLVTAALGSNVPVALMKGLPNYVCRRRHQEFRLNPESFQPQWARSLRVIDSWLEREPSGATSELADVREDDPIWPRITASSERRIGPGCAHFDTCYVTAMKREAARARIVVVNHHLFFADIALRGAHPASVIPDYDAVIFDEAHQLEDIATEHFGITVSTARIARLCSDAFPLLERELGGAAAAHAHRIAERGEAFFDAVARSVRASEGRALLEPSAWSGEVESRWFELDTAIEGLGARTHAISQELERREPDTRAHVDVVFGLERRAAALRDDLASIAQGKAGAVVWFESSGRSRKVSASPIELAPLLRTRLFDVVPSVILTSATLSSAARSAESAPPAVAASSERGSYADASDDALPSSYDGGLDIDAMSEAGPAPSPLGNSPFRFFRQRLGLDAELYRVEELSVASPFRFEQQALLYLPSDLPAPDSPEFPEAVAERTRLLVEGCDGGAFVLTTSLRAMHAVHRALEGRLGQRLLLLSGQAPKGALLERFRAAGTAVLVATLGFWQGVDVPGQALRLVVLEKVPFPVPTDPILRARAHALEQAGASPFTELHLPLAQLALKQGFGRLIRQQSDYGVVALFDHRVLRRGYGRRLLAGLPPARRVTELADVTAFWRSRLEAAAS